MNPIERIFRTILLAPVVDISHANVDKTLPSNCIRLSGDEQTRLAVNPGDVVVIKVGKRQQTAIVLDGETSISELIQELYGDELSVRRNLGAIVLKEFFLLSITIVGMLIVILTLSGDTQKIAAVLSILGFLGHFFSLRLFRGKK